MRKKSDIQEKVTNVHERSHKFMWNNVTNLREKNSFFQIYEKNIIFTRKSHKFT